MGRLVMDHQEERLVPRPLFQEVDGPVGDHVGDVLPRVGLLSFGVVEDGIHVGALAREDFPSIEADGIAAEVPLAYHPRVVAACLEKSGDGRS